MVKILLICSRGMTSRLMVNKMQSAASRKGIKAEIWAVGDAEAADNIDRADLLMLGPQIRYLEPKMKIVAGEKPVAVIDIQAYGVMNGEKVLEQALEVLHIL